MWRSLAIVLSVFWIGTAAAQVAPPTFDEAQNVYENRFSDKGRIVFQVKLTAAGFLNAVPTERYSLRIFEGTRRLQFAAGLPATGIMTGDGMEALDRMAKPLIRAWGFEQVIHPVAQRSIWIPMGLGLTNTPSRFGYSYSDPGRRFSVSFNYFPGVTPEMAFEEAYGNAVRNGKTVHYKVFKNGWFVLSTTDIEGIDGYQRYHFDGRGMVGFTAFWNNANGDIGGDRIAILMSGSLLSAMEGTPFVNAPKKYLPEVSAIERPLERPAMRVPVPVAPSSTPFAPPARLAALPPVAQPPAAPQTPKGNGISTGTGITLSSFLVATNAHVVKGCSVVNLRFDDGAVIGGRISATDTTSDLALIRLDAPRAGAVAKLRGGARLGESVAAFGFPHSDILAKSGNFTLGNVTALAGVNDDERYYQMSAAVQPGNSGGPLLDGNGNLVGVVTAKLNALKVAQSTGDIPQNINFALKANVLRSFLQANQVSYSEGLPGKASLSPADLADQAKAVSSFITCRN